MQAFFRKVAESSKGQQIASVEQIRFITPELATVDGSWTVTGARGADGKELAPIKGRGFEAVQKRNGKWEIHRNSRNGDLQMRSYLPLLFLQLATGCGRRTRVQNSPLAAV
jgi:hypothetical protein